MNIEHHSGCDRSVTENFSQRFDVKSRLHATGSKGMPQGVEGVIGNVVTAQKLLVSQIKAVRFDEVMILLEEVNTVRFPLLLYVFRQENGQWNRTDRFFCLWFGNDNFCSVLCGGGGVCNALYCACNLHSLAFKINVTPSQATDLSDPES